jgi:hypothetical protein
MLSTLFPLPDEYQSAPPTLPCSAHLLPPVPQACTIPYPVHPIQFTCDSKTITTPITTTPLTLPEHLPSIPEAYPPAIARHRCIYLSIHTSPPTDRPTQHNTTQRSTQHAPCSPPNRAPAPEPPRLLTANPPDACLPHPGPGTPSSTQKKHAQYAALRCAVLCYAMLCCTYPPTLPTDPR